MSFAPDQVLAALPHARRYARALTGDQARGDALVAAAIPDLQEGLPARLALHAAISRLAPEPEAAPDGLGARQRQLLLLTTIEELSLAVAAAVVGLAPDAAEQELAEARARLRRAAATSILIIEDEPVIALELKMLIEGCGHRVAGIAATEAQAVRLAAEREVGLILADVNLGRGGNGIAAVRQILAQAEVPVIFVTAYPEQLLTAEGVEPAFVMRKPFDPLTLAVSTFQALHAGRVPLTGASAQPRAAGGVCP